jgi:hypothetical protein
MGVALALDGTVYFGCYDYRLYALDTNGTPKWSYVTFGSLGPPAIGADGTIYVISKDKNIYAINPDGTKKWSAATTISCGTPTISSTGIIYVIGSYNSGGYNPNSIQAFYPDGSQYWISTVSNTGGVNGGDNGVANSVVLATDGTIYISAGNLIAINPDGTQKWTYIPINNDKIIGPPSIGIDGTIYCGANGSDASPDGHLVLAISPLGSLLWSFRTHGDITRSPAVATDGTIYIPSDDVIGGVLNTTLYALNPNGTQLWSFIPRNQNNQIIDSIWSSPIITNDGTVYFGGSAFTGLYAVYGSSASANSAWPMKGHDLRQTHRQIVAPVVTGVNPASGSTNGGVLVTITGNYFANGFAVLFGGASATAVTALDATHITCTTPNHSAGTVDVTITNLDGKTGTASGAFTYIAPPQIASLSPTHGSTLGGSAVTITGIAFATSGVVTVTIGGVPATGVTVLSSTQVTCAAPSHSSGPFNVVITNPDGQSSTLANGFTFISPPSLTSLSTTTCDSNGDVSVTLNGANFLTGANIAFGGAAATDVAVANATQITCTTPPHAAGVVDVVVTNWDGQAASLLGAFTYTQAPPPTATGITPTGGSTAGGRSVSVSGTLIARRAQVSFGGAWATAVTITGTVKVDCTTPTHAVGLVDVSVVNPDGQAATLSGAFMYYTPLSFTSSPTATPNPSTAGGPTQFSCGTSLSDATVSWAFGDGTSATGAAGSHVFLAAGTFTATATSVHDASGQSLTGTVNVTVVWPGGVGDADGDGFPNEIEVALGSNPVVAGSTPFDLPAVQASTGLVIAKMGIKLNFAKPNNDSITLQGILPIDDGFQPGGKAILDVGGVIKTFDLNTKEASTPRSTTTSFKLTVKSKKGVVLAQNAKFSVKLLRGAFAVTLADEGLANTNVRNSAVMIPVVIVLADRSYTQTTQRVYTAKINRSGMAK